MERCTFRIIRDNISGELKTDGYCGPQNKNHAYVLLPSCIGCKLEEYRNTPPGLRNQILSEDEECGIQYNEDGQCV